MDSQHDQTPEPYGLSDDIVSNIIDAMDDNYHDAVIDTLHQLSPADIADLLGKLSEDNRERLLVTYRQAIPSNAIAELDTELKTQIVSQFDSDQIAYIVDELESDDALIVISDLDEELQKQVTEKLSVKTRLTLEQGLRYPEQSAGRLMQHETVAVPEFWTVGQTIDYMREEAANLPTDFFDVFVISPSHKVIGEVPLNRLLRSSRETKLAELALEDIHAIPATLDQEEVAQIFRRENLSSAPVVDEDERLAGVITIDDVVDVIDQEAEEDLLKLAGVENDDLYQAVFRTTNSRFRWLLINLFTAIMASCVISLFDATLENMVAVAILMPIVASMGGNAGTQALTVAVRALATRELSKSNAYRIIWKETLVGLFNGLAFALIMGGVTMMWFDNPLLGAIMGAAMVINLFIAGLCGAGIPIMLDRMGSDPAVSSTVFVTTVTDIVGFFVFLGLATIALTAL
jgi:magnesium transporter